MRRRDPAFCFGVLGIAKAPWRPTKEDAEADAIDAGYATRYEHSKTVYLTVPGEIWYTHDLVPVIPRGAPFESTAADRQPSRIDRIIARREDQQREAG